MASRPILTTEFVRQVLDYDSDTGVLTWRMRTDVGPEWNTCFAGKEAGRIDHWGYRVVIINGRPYKAHRVAWLHYTGQWPSGWLDHKNCIRSDNRFANLRRATPRENGANRGIDCRNKSGLKGVSFCKTTKRWRASITIDRRAYNLGRFGSKEDAHKAYMAAAIAAKGEFARAA